MLYGFAKVVMNILMRFKNRYKIVGRENVPREGALLFAYNHKSNNDPIVAGMTCPRRLNFMAKAELFENKFSGKIISALGAVPVHRGKGDIGAVKTTFNVLKNGGTMLIFPEGGRVKDGKRKKAKTGIIMIAQKAQVPIVPVLIDGDYKLFSKITVIYGKPVSFEEYYGEKPDPETAQMLADGLMDRVYGLKDNVYSLKDSEV